MHYVFTGGSAQAQETDWLPIFVSLAAITIAGGSLLVALRALRRGGYKITVKASKSLRTIALNPEYHNRGTTIKVDVSNKRMGKVQIRRLVSKGADQSIREAKLNGEALGYTFDGIHHQFWDITINQQVRNGDEPPVDTPVCFGAELPNGKIIWSDWITLDLYAASPFIELA